MLLMGVELGICEIIEIWERKSVIEREMLWWVKWQKKKLRINCPTDRKGSILAWNLAS